jgi:hypothetical protein
LWGFFVLFWSFVLIVCVVIFKFNQPICLLIQYQDP